jgi:hypothetical protein
VSRFRVVLSVVAIFALGGAGCAWSPWLPKEKVKPPANAPRPLHMLTLGVPHDDFLDCPNTDCNHWYRVDVDGLGVLRVDVESQLNEADENITRVVIRGAGSKTLAQGVGIHGEDLVVETAVGPGMYGVLVQGGGKARAYKLTVSFGAKAKGNGEGYPDAPAEPESPAFDVQ